MAISFDASSSQTTYAPATGFQYTVTLNASATLLVAEVEIPVAQTVSGITYGGVSNTGSLNQVSASGVYNTYFFWWLNPPTGANFLNVQFAGGSPATLVLRASSYIGAANSAPVTSVTTASSATSTFTTNTVTPSVANSWVIGTIENSVAAITAGTGTFFRAGAGNGDGIFDSNGAVSVATALQGTTAAPVSWTAMIGAFAPTTSGITGTAAWTEAQDIWTGAGGVQDNGTAAWVEAKDIWAGAGGVLVSGTAAWTEAADTWAGVGTVLVSGAAAWTEAQDTWAGAGTVASGITGTAAWTEAQDTWAGAGAVLVSGAAAWTEQQDIWSGTGSVTLPAITGTGAWTEAPDRWSGQGTNGLLIDYDTGKRKKRADKRRDKELAEDRAKNERRRQQMLDAFERTFEGKIDLSEPALQEMVKAVERQENIPDGPNFEAVLANLSNIEALWRDYLDRDDEEVLLLL